MTPNQDKATARPWHLSGDMVITKHEDSFIARCAGDTDQQAEANARLIVTAVNEHDNLKKIAAAHRKVGEMIIEAGINGNTVHESAVNLMRQFTALLEVEKAAMAYLHAGDSVDMHGDKLESALANLAAVRKGVA